MDHDGKAIAPFVRENCGVVTGDTTLAPVTWDGGDLSRLAGQRVRFRFHLRQGALLVFWVSPSANGASHGYIAAGGPGFAGARDVEGLAAYEAAAGLAGPR